MNNLSAAAVLGDYLFLASDESADVQVLKKLPGDLRYEKHPPICLLPDKCDQAKQPEIDIEAIAVAGSKVYVLGSHSKVRGKVKTKNTRAENRRRMEEVESDTARENVFRFDFDPSTGKASHLKSISLMRVIAKNLILQRFVEIPGKENGIDIEGLAVANGKLYIGFRSPVLRGNLVPIMEMSWDDPADHQLHFVNLGGLGIRDMVAVPNAFLLLAGPPADAEGPDEIYSWNGQDDVPGKDVTTRSVSRIRRLDSIAGSHAEAMALLASKDHCHDLIVLVDGVPGGAPRSISVCVAQ
jgi:hypothetical protein